MGCAVVETVMVAVAVAAMAARAAVVMTIVVAKAVPRAAPGAVPQALGEPFVKEQPATREARRAHLRRGAARTGRSRQSTALVGASRHLANGALGRAWRNFALSWRSIYCKMP